MYSIDFVVESVVVDDDDVDGYDVDDDIVMNDDDVDVDVDVDVDDEILNEIVEVVYNEPMVPRSMLQHLERK